MERYSEYKNSGVKWLGEIPSHWEVMPIKYISKVSSGATPKTSVQGYWDGNITWVTPADFKTETKFVFKGNRNITTLGVKSCSTVLLPKGSLVFSKRAPIGQVSISKLPLCTNQGCFGIIPNDSMNNSFLYYSLAIHAKSFNTLGSGTTFRELSFSAFSSYKISVPPKAEQDAIVRYLDAATSKIDKAIAMQQKMIDLLNERKQIIIQNAVTKGIDENVEMKDSGVEWIGMIPKHWEIEPFGKHFTFGKGLPITKANLQEEGIAVISYGQVHAKYNLGTTLTETLVRYVSPKYLETHPQCLLNKNDFIFADTSEDVEGSGNFAFNDYKDKIFAGYHTVVARPKDLIYPKYYAYLFKSRAWKSQIQSLVNGVKVYSIGKRILKTSTLLIPCESEQKEIVKVLDLKTAAIEKSIENISRQITLLQERKQIIINEVVTGKVKVS